ncbi:hypothetical protein [Streptomyces sp. NPDC093089]|uniref:hypothetical protein n=1 Tax=Streptomyces sp. NPDC093089 TaxID=3366024 RepID=UPI00381EB924
MAELKAELKTDRGRFLRVATTAEHQQDSAGSFAQASSARHACRELRGDAPDAPRDRAATFDAACEVARARNLPVEF